jgi:hypothetical protein
MDWQARKQACWMARPWGLDACKRVLYSQIPRHTWAGWLSINRKYTGRSVPTLPSGLLNGIYDECQYLWPVEWSGLANLRVDSDQASSILDRSTGAALSGRNIATMRPQQ